MNKRPKICGIVAVGPDNIIGHNGRLPWHSRHDLHFFKKTTMGHPCIFGRNTYENLPVKPLPGRLNIICSSSYKNIEQDGDVIRVPSLEEAIKQCGNVDQVFICGGAQLYDYALSHNLIDVMYLTRVYILDNAQKQQIQNTPELNTYFPYGQLDWRKWRLESTWFGYNNQSLPPELPGIKTCFFKYERIR